MKYIIANWKANKTLSNANQWIDSFLKNDFSRIKQKAQIIICPPFPFIPLIKEKIKGYDFLKVGAQDVSFFEKGQYTGETTIENLASLIDYVIIGHSERRFYFNETDRILFQKFYLAKENKIEPIFCMRGSGDLIPAKARFIAYEPVSAIGTGNNEPLKKVLEIKKFLPVKKEVIFIYGGSVNEKNASYYLKNREIDGVLVGTASLNELELYHITTSF